MGLNPRIFESEPGRASVVARMEGTDSSRGALLIHGHLDVVAADPAHWTVDPFAGEIKDGCLWGRGAVDMKDMDAMSLAVVRQWMREGRKPPRDVVIAYVADEEAGGSKARSGWSTTSRNCSTAAPNRSVKSAASPFRSATTCGSTRCRPRSAAWPG